MVVAYVTASRTSYGIPLLWQKAWIHSWPARFAST